jgi:hypothetical protein
VELLRLRKRDLERQIYQQFLPSSFRNNLRSAAMVSPQEWTEADHCSTIFATTTKSRDLDHQCEWWFVHVLLFGYGGANLLCRGK